MSQFRTIDKSMFIDSLNTTANCNKGKAGAIIESTITNGCYAVGDADGG